jgi:hypothetical protein
MNRLYLNGALILAVIVSLHISRPAKAPSVIGHAVDGAGYPVPGVSVTAMPEAGGPRKSAMTAADGAYQFESLPEGTYRVDFEILGFDLARRNHVRVRQNSTASADGTVFVSGVCECVTVIDGTSVRERAGQVVDESDRPLRMRGWRSPVRCTATLDTQTTKDVSESAYR